MTVVLRFSAGLGPQPGGAVVLRFGGAGEPPPVDPGVPAGLLRAGLAAPWQRAEPAPPVAVAAPWRAAGRLGEARVAPWQPGRATGVPLGSRWSAAAPAPARVTLAPWGNGAPQAGATRMPWRAALARRAEVLAPWLAALGTTAGVQAAWRMGRAASLGVRAPWRQGQPTRVAASARVGGATPVRPGVRAPWRDGQGVTSVGGPWSPAPATLPAPVPCYQPDPGGTVGLLFREALTGLAALVFACRNAAIALVPVRRVYMVTNVTTLTRVDGGASIPCLGFSLSLDADSWAWGFSASIRPDALALIEPNGLGEPVELEAMVNGTAFRVLVESISRERAFGQLAMRVQGRGKTAVLDSPFSPIQVFSEVDALTSQQLLDQSLPIGWTANWGLTAWLVPGGVWSHQGTPISAAVAIAAAGGGYVQPHASLSQISVLPRYPVAPWAWGGVTPDIEVPSAVMTREAIEWQELPRYNAVYVSGTTTGGVLRLVKRTGTAGDVLATMVTDPLITHSDAARQRGLPVLARTGRWADVTLRLPVLPETGVIRPGAFVRYVDGATTRLGLVRSSNVDIAFGEVWQSIKVETHVD